MIKPIKALIILDGFGCRSEKSHNAIALARTPHIHHYMAHYPHTTLGASGLDVGLPDGQMGNSEVGHLNIGAGRVVYQKFTGINFAIEKGAFYQNKAFLDVIAHCKQKRSKLHLMGLVSDGGVHSHNSHLYALVELAKRQGLEDVFIHCFMDGRDVPPTSGKEYIIALENALKEKHFGQIATVMGRYYAMDRDNRWERVEKAYRAMAMGEGVPVESAAEAMEKSYAQEITDEFVLPAVVMKGDKPVAQVEAEDGIIFFNFRPDRAREITRVFTDSAFQAFKRPYKPVKFVCLTPYDHTFKNISIAYDDKDIEAFLPAQSADNLLGKYLADSGLTQLRIAETEKYAHVTFFFNGGIETPNKGEDRILIPSPKVPTYDLKPEMSAYEVADKAVACIYEGKYDVMILNFANPDMVGHTGVKTAAIKAIEAVDVCVGKVTEAVLQVGGSVILTADHGNAEYMYDEKTGLPFTAHTTFPVPCIVIDEKSKGKQLRQGGKLCDLAPTLLQLLNLPIPKEMTGKSLI